MLYKRFCVKLTLAFDNRKSCTSTSACERHKAQAVTVENGHATRRKQVDTGHVAHG